MSDESRSPTTPFTGTRRRPRRAPAQHAAASAPRQAGPRGDGADKPRSAGPSAGGKRGGRGGKNADKHGGKRGGAGPREATPSGQGMAARRVAARVVDRVLREGAFLAQALSAELDRTGLDPKDRGLATELAYGTVRHAGALRSSLQAASSKGKKIDRRVLPHALVAAYQLQWLAGRIPAHAAVNCAVSAVRKVRPQLAGFTNAVLRNLGPSLAQKLGPHSTHDDVAAAYGFAPDVLRAMATAQSATDLRADEGYDVLDVHQALPADLVATAELAAGLCARPPLAVRITPAEADVEGLFDTWEMDGATVVPHAFVPRTGMVEGAGAVQRLAGFADGAVTVQDPGSQLCALLLAPAEGATVLDMCAAPGGKSVMLAEAAGKGGSVLAVDIQAAKLPRIADNAARLGVQLDTRAADATTLADDSSLIEAFDAIMLDAPCSGLGTLRRHPEIKLRRTLDDVAASADTQSALLDVAAKLLKPGGTLVYSVCSPMPAEGRDQVAAFLARTPGFVQQDATAVLPWLPADAVDAAGGVQLAPHLHDADAFYAARLVKQG